MHFISTYIEVDELASTVSFINDEPIEVESIDAWIISFESVWSTKAAELEGCSQYTIERATFDAVTCKPCKPNGNPFWVRQQSRNN